MKKLYAGVLFFTAVLFFNSHHIFAQENLQSLIDEAKPGETIHLKNKVYEGPITLTKPITLTGSEKTVLQSKGKSPVVTVKGKEIHLKGFNIKQLTSQKKVPALEVKGRKNSATKLKIQTTSLGINLDNVHDSMFSHLIVKGNQQENGVNVLNSTKNKIGNLRVSEVLDGIYIENSDSNTFVQNTVQHSRYGFHLMFSNHLFLYQNSSKQNYIGAMVMETSRSIIKENAFTQNAQNVNSYGLLLFDTTDTKVVKNDLSSNRIGIKLQSSARNSLTQNSIKTNFIGIQFDDASSNIASTNMFLGNVNDVQAIASKNNNMDKNYWDSSWKVDAKNNGTSIIPYKADPFFLSLTKETPEYQIFFQSPGMVLLQKMLKSPDQLILSDRLPLVNIPHKQLTQNLNSARGLLLMGIGMILLSALCIQMGRKTK
ncbi:MULTISPECIES: right-handed parallel beta-helix repeat-containing protein [Priestia]|uniref:right-handed parallel beta-helix repeat-containing protein n=1 Tax=Priestia TaxID=2800373 RepID=UPI0013F60675|nr:NosD domain-containing protein [Priestia megaterium]MEB4856023.1 NosD domain-containing protein [Priestia megaterium]NHH96076.1 hypothetical protein [Bacillus sp. MB95]